MTLSLPPGYQAVDRTLPPNVVSSLVQITTPSLRPYFNKMKISIYVYRKPQSDQWRNQDQRHLELRKKT